MLRNCSVISYLGRIAQNVHVPIPYLKLKEISTEDFWIIYSINGRCSTITQFHPWGIMQKAWQKWDTNIGQGNDLRCTYSKHGVSKIICCTESVVVNHNKFTIQWKPTTHDMAYCLKSPQRPNPLARIMGQESLNMCIHSQSAILYFSPNIHKSKWCHDVQGKICPNKILKKKTKRVPSQKGSALSQTCPHGRIESTLTRSSEKSKVRDPRVVVSLAKEKVWCHHTEGIIGRRLNIPWDLYKKSKKVNHDMICLYIH